MALKINKQIGTDRGITTGAYIRIVNYTISKLGYGRFDIEIFMSEDDCKKPSSSINETLQARSQEIGNELTVQLLEKKMVTEINTTSAIVDVTEDREVPGSDPIAYEKVIVGTKIETYETEVQVERLVPTLKAVETEGLFAFAYGRLREKLVQIYGENYVVNV